MSAEDLKKERKRAYDKKYRESNKEAIYLRRKKYRSDNRETISLKRKEYRSKNLETIRLSKNKSYHKNREKVLQKARAPKKRFNALKYAAKKRQLTLEISFDEWYTKIRNNKCSYCTGPLSESGHAMDRIDNKIGYTDANTVACCKKCNVAKNNLSMTEFLDLVAKIYKNLIQAPQTHIIDLKPE